MPNDEEPKEPPPMGADEKELAPEGREPKEELVPKEPPPTEGALRVDIPLPLPKPVAGAPKVPETPAP